MTFEKKAFEVTVYITYNKYLGYKICQKYTFSD